MIDPGEFAALTANAENSYKAPAPQAKGNFFTHLLPTLGGLVGGAGGGAAGGALAGTAVLPGVGTAVGGLLGALLGGAAGGAGGKVLENKTEGKSLGSGVGGQALEQGVLSAGPLRLLKGAKTLGEGTLAATKGSGSLLDALNASGDAAAAPGLLTKARGAIADKGAQMEARAGGFGVGEKAPGGVQLGVQDSRQIGKTLQANGIKPGTPEARLQQVETKLGTVGKQIDSHVNQNNTRLNPGDVKQIAADYLNQIQQQPGADQLVLKKAANFASNLEKQVKDTKSLINFRRGLDQQVINFNANGQGASPAAQIAARTLRGVLSDRTEQLAPGISDLNRAYSQLTDAAGFLKGGAKAVSDQSQGGGGGVLGFIRTNDTSQGIKSAVGNAAQKAAPSEAPNAFGTKAIAARTLPVGVASSLPQLVKTTPTTQSTAMSPMNASMPSNISDLSQTPDQNASTNPFDPSNIGTSIETLLAHGGTSKDVQQFLAMATSINSLQQSTQKSANTVKPTGQQYGLAQGGLNSLQQIDQLIQQDPAIVEKNATPGQGLPLVGSYITHAAGAGDYHALADNVLQSLIHLETGATATPEEVKAARGQLPQPGDSAQVKQQKLSNLASMFAPYIQGGQLGNANTNDLISALGGA